MIATFRFLNKALIVTGLGVFVLYAGITLDLPEIVTGLALLSVGAIPAAIEWEKL